MTSEEYFDLVGKIHALVITEIQQYTYASKDPVEVYPKLVIMYEFFRLLRGEAFMDFRPHSPGSGDENNFMKWKMRLGTH